MKYTGDYLNEFARTNKVFFELSEDDRNKLKNCLLEMYQDVVRVCDKYNLCIMLGGGSALGAVRHQGFIPWDDDLDVMMPRKDYNKLIEVFDKELSDKYMLMAPRTKEDSEILFMQILKRNTSLKTIVNNIIDEKKCIYIDIFPIENAPTNKWIRKLIGIIVFYWHVLLYSVGIYKAKDPLYKQLFMLSFKSKLVYYARYLSGMLFSVFPRQVSINLFDQFVSKIKGNEYCTIPTGRKKYNGEALPRKVFFPVSKAIFEGMEVNVPCDVNAYLTNLYGNYMQIPPPEKRERHFYTEFILNTTRKKCIREDVLTCSQNKI